MVQILHPQILMNFFYRFYLLDLAISNRPNGGIAVGRITELNGLESSGKSLVGSYLLASTQKRDGVAVYIDTETALVKIFKSYRL